MRAPTIRLLAACAATALALAGCAGDTTTTPADESPSAASSASSSTTPSEGESAASAATASAASGGQITIEHALGTTTVAADPERIATVNWANHEVPLALGVVPVGMAAATFGDDDDDGLHPWVEERLEELGGEPPVLFDETDGIDFEAVADTDPDVILAAYSGLTPEDYATLSEIAPTVAYPEAAWLTPWREMIRVNSAAMGMPDEGEALVADLEAEIDEVVAGHPGLDGAATMFMTHVDPSDFSEIGFYTALDARVDFFDDLGLTTPPSIEEESAGGEDFFRSVSAEQVDTFDDVEIIVTYGDDELIDTLQDDPLLSQLPALAADAVVNLPLEGPMGTAANPTPLAISWVLEDYVALLAEAAEAAEAIPSP